MSLEQSYINLYTTHRAKLFAGAPDALNQYRDVAMETFRMQGFPSRKVEDYRYIDVNAAFDGKQTYSMPLKTTPLGETKGKPIGVNNIELLNRYYTKAADNQDPITALNTALTQECLCIHVAKNQQLEKPIELTDIFAAGTDQMEHKRILIVLEEGASAVLLLHYMTRDKFHYLATQVIEVFVGDNANLQLYELEETHTSCTRFNNVYFHMGRYATVKHNNIALFNGVTRNTVKAYLKGEYGEVTLNGCVMADKNQVVDNNTLIRHDVPNCTSHELYKYVVDEQSVGAFAGKVYVAEGAQKSVSEEVNQNICASDEARMYTQPMLEIYADDVKCSHGSTVGKLDEMALFYLRQRGIPLAEARMLLMQAFVGQVIEEIPIAPLRDRLHIMIEQRLKGEFDKCVGCARCDK
ncbi:MAG: Fe-S cluster assembly protein SufD [Bacteroidaceae bacterium]|nr:Fe-S cluster assembly protein SufD [Bacteroidaceae bacterium]